MNRPLLDGQPRRRSALTIALGILLALACLFLLSNVLLTTFTYAVAVDGTSMENTVRDGDVVYALRSFTARRGDVVIIDVKDDPAFHEGGRKTDTIIKRLIAVEGDGVKCEGGVVYIKRDGGGWEALKEGYTKGRTPDFKEVTVGEGEIFFLGDHRSVSLDSSEVGTRAYSDIIGVVPAWAISVKAITTGWENFRAAVREIFE